MIMMKVLKQFECIEQVSLEDIKGGNLSGSGKCCSSNGDCNINIEIGNGSGNGNKKKESVEKK